MPSLLELLEAVYPDWPEHHARPIEAAIEAGLIDEEELEMLDRPALNFHDEEK